MHSDIHDTIVAVATAPGEAGIGIVRISGTGALRIAEAIFRAKDRTRPVAWTAYRMHYGWIVDPGAGGKIIDEVLLSVMRAPRSYTREDVVEINCHGGFVAVRAVLDAVLSRGCRLAEPGEFTRRAFLNGRIDLSQAEAVLDVIRAKTDAALRMGVEQLRGALSRKLAKIQKTLLDQAVCLEAQIDFPEDAAEGQAQSGVRANLAAVSVELSRVLAQAFKGRILREGIHVVICGRTNVGKSSLLNALLKQERSIVTPVAGTTRDTIEEIVDIQGIPVRIVDTAGILKPRDVIEHKAVARSRRYITMADLALVLFDASRSLGREDRSIIRKLKHRPCLAVINKIDLPRRLDEQIIEKNFRHVVRVSAKKGRNLGELEKSIAEMACRGHLLAKEPVLVSNRRHAEKLKEAQKSVAESLKSLDNGVSIEFVAQGVRDALACIEEILGRRVAEGLLDRIFAQFCVGK